MQIAASSMTLTAVQSRVHAEEEKSRLKVWDERSQQQGNKQINAREEHFLQDAEEAVSAAGKTDEPIDALAGDAKLRSMILALEALTGRKIRIETFRASLQAYDVTPPSAPADDASRREGWGIDFSYSKELRDTQALDFAAAGKVSLKDGSSIELSVAFSMKSVQIRHENLSFKAGDALIDPLVINFDGGTLQLGDIRHTFDLDLDGKLDTIAFVGSGSGFLALDRNSDGYINDGSELFGPSEGDGFAELAAYDSDANGWIDEADEIFSKLLIWTKESDGTQRLFTLKEKGIGAIYLTNVATDFDYVNSLNGYDGKLRASSIFLGENGEAGTVQEVDLTV